MAQKTTPVPVSRALQKLGTDLRNARRRRRISTQVMAQRASISRTTLSKAEKGEAGVSIGTIATLIFILGLLDHLTELADVRQDTVGLDLSEDLLPQRIRTSRRS